MKMNVEILAVETQGDALQVKVQGKEKRAAKWRPMLAFSIQIPDTEKTRRAFYIGRVLRMTLDPVQEV